MASDTGGRNGENHHDRYYGDEGSNDYGSSYNSGSYGGSRRGRGGEGSRYKGRGKYYDSYGPPRDGYHGRYKSYSKGRGDSSYRSQDTFEGPAEPRSENGPEPDYEEQSFRSGSGYDSYRGSGYRGSSYRGSSYRGGRGRGHHSHQSNHQSSHQSSHRSSHQGSHSNNEQPVKSRPSISKAKSYNNPWIETLGIENDATVETLESRYNELQNTNKEIMDLQVSKLKLERSLASLEAQSLREEAHVQVATEKLDEFTYI